MKTLTHLYNSWTICLYKNLFIRSFIYSEINTFGLPKCSKISFAFNIFVPIPVQEMVYLKAMQKIPPNGRFCVRNHRSKNISEKIKGVFILLSPPPLDPLCLSCLVEHCLSLAFSL